MNKIRLIALFIISAWLLQSCKKDTFSATVGNPNLKLQAFIDATVWDPVDTITTTLTYSSAAKNKLFFCQGTIAQKQVAFAIKIPTNSNTPGFNLGTYVVDAAATTTMQYFTQQQNAAGNYVFVPTGTTGPGSGSVTITAVDSVAKVITGSFSFISRKTNLDGSGNISSIEIHNISAGVFNKLPYTFTSN